ncbi:MAG: hypothetical protein ACYCVZ_02285 [Streptosporangiaceae bacterium]
MDAFSNWLECQGRAVTREAGFADVYTEPGGEQLCAEAKGRTAEIGLDVDTLYGQLLRRMTEPSASTRYAVVVPAIALTAARQVPAQVRGLLHIYTCEVDDSGQVHPRD